MAATSSCPSPSRTGWIGRLDRVKGFDLALKAIASIVTRFPTLRLTIAGDGPEHLELEQQINELGLQAVVDMVGWVHPDKVRSLIDTVTLVVIPSRSEGLPQVSIEAGLMGRPVVATGVGGLPEIIVHGRTGLLVEPENSPALAEAIGYLLDHEQESIQMGSAARTHVQGMFRLEPLVDSYDTLYQKLVMQ